MPKQEHISESVIRRLPRYYRFLGELMNEGITKISSRELSEKMRLTASQIRQDLNCFGGFGQQGYGYNVSELRGEIGTIIGINKQIPTILIGAGNLGRALSSYLNFPKYGTRLVGIFDNNKELTGVQLADLEIKHTDELENFCKIQKPKIAILCIPKSSVYKVCDKLINLEVFSFWNFSHFDLKLHFENVVVENVHLGDSLLTLVYSTNNF